MSGHMLHIDHIVTYRTCTHRQRNTYRILLQTAISIQQTALYEYSSDRGARGGDSNQRFAFGVVVPRPRQGLAPAKYEPFQDFVSYMIGGILRAPDGHLPVGPTPVSPHSRDLLSDDRIHCPPMFRNIKYKIAAHVIL